VELFGNDKIVLPNEEINKNCHEVFVILSLGNAVVVLLLNALFLLLFSKHVVTT